MTTREDQIAAVAEALRLADHSSWWRMATAAVDTLAPLLTVGAEK